MILTSAAAAAQTQTLPPIAQHVEELLAKGSSADDVEEEVDGVVEDEERSTREVPLERR